MAGIPAYPMPSDPYRFRTQTPTPAGPPAYGPQGSPSGMSPSASPADVASAGKVITLGPLRAAPLSVALEEERRKTEIAQAQPIISQLAGHVRTAWTTAWDAKRNTVQTRMLQNLRARRGEYDPEKLAEIQNMGGSDVYAMLTSVKCRAAASWLRDVLLTNGTEKPWTIRPTPIPTLPPTMSQAIVEQVVKPMTEAAMMGAPMPDEQVLDLMGQLRDQALNEVRAQARTMSERMENKMEDQLTEGGFIHALNQFIDDIVTFPAAILKGPVVRNKFLLKWVQDARGAWTVQNEKQIHLEWERVSPFNIYPSPESEGINDGYLIEKHTLSRKDLNDLIGVEGYDDGAIRLVLDQYARGGLRDWLYDEVARQQAEGKSGLYTLTNPDGLIDALQYWGSVPGKILIEYGMSDKEITDPTQEYHCEIWLIGSTVIKATLNYHPLAEKPYYKASYEEIPGAFWGNSPADLIRDAQVVVNAATRALVNNMGLSSGPQVMVNVDRLAVGEDVTTLRPWRIWQVTSDPMANGSYQREPITFEQPKSNVQELAGIIKTFMDLADEWSGIPKYLTGDAPGGAGRTASGLSMLMSNAGKSLKQVVANVDNYVLRPLLQRLHYWNMKYSDDDDLKGDINVVVRGANALVAKESAQVRRNEFLATTANPYDMQIIGPEGRSQVLREVVKTLDMDTDRIIPTPEMLKLRQAQALAAQMQAQAQAPAQGGTPAQPSGPTPAAPGGPSASGQTLMDGAPQTDNFSPSKAP